MLEQGFHESFLPFPLVKQHLSAHPASRMWKLPAILWSSPPISPPEHWGHSFESPHLAPCGAQILNSGAQFMQKVLLPSEPSLCPLDKILFASLFVFRASEPFFWQMYPDSINFSKSISVFGCDHSFPVMDTAPNKCKQGPGPRVAPRPRSLTSES